MRATTVSARSAGEFALGGGAGSSMRSTLLATIASTTSAITAIVVARPAPPLDGDDRAGHRRRERVDRRAVEQAPGPSAPRRRPRGPVRFVATRRLGTIDPLAASRTPSRATRPSHSRLGPDAVAPVAAADGDQPPERILQRDRERLGACAVGSGTPAWSSQPSGGPPIASSRVGQLVVRLGGRATAGRPHHDLPGRPRRLELHLLAARGPRRDGSTSSRSACGGRRRAAGAGGPPWTAGCRACSAKSATTWSRSSPYKVRTASEVVLGLVDQPVEQRERGVLVGVQQAPGRRASRGRRRSTRSPLRVVVRQPLNSGTDSRLTCLGPGAPSVGR